LTVPSRHPLISISEKYTQITQEKASQIMIIIYQEI